MGEKLEKIYPFGGKGGAPFAEEVIREIGLATGDFVDRIYLNGKAFGGGRGRETNRLVLKDDEFICELVVRYGSYIDYLKFTTNKGRWIEGGGRGGQQQILSDIKLIAIAGRAWSYVDYLEFRMLIDASINPKPQDRT